MTNEEMILQKLDRIEAQLSPVVQTAKSIKEFKEDLTPLSSQAIRMVIEELEDVESSFQLEDLLILAKRMLRSARNITFALDQLENMIDFVTTIEPLLKSTVPQIIHYLDELEQKGVLRVIQSMLDVRAKVANAYTAEDIDQIGDGAVALLGLAKKFSDPHTLALLEKLTEIPARVDLSRSKPVGPFGLLAACGTREVKGGLGVVLELTRAMGTLKETVQPVEPAEASAPTS